jgi:hypothetical protein
MALRNGLPGSGVSMGSKAFNWLSKEKKNRTKRKMWFGFTFMNLGPGRFNQKAAAEA